MTQESSFPPFSLSRLLKTVFAPEAGERIAILIDLKNPEHAAKFAFLSDSKLTIQALAYKVFYEGLRNGVLKELELKGGELFAYQITGGSNLDLPESAWNTEGKKLSLEKDIYPKYDIILCISTYSATAPLTAAAKKIGFRGATLHGLNDIILSSGLAVDYNGVSKNTEALRLGMTKADYFEIDFEVLKSHHTLCIVTDKQEAQKSHGLCRGKKPDIANLPAGEVYYVPKSAEGTFPLRYDDGTIGLLTVRGGRITYAKFLSGNRKTVDEHNEKLKSDPVTGEIGELGFGTQALPVSGRDIQDEKILGTVHIATGRSDHLGGHLTPKLFANPKNATHDDILFAPSKTPEITVRQVRMNRDGKTLVVLENFKPSTYLVKLLKNTAR